MPDVASEGFAQFLPVALQIPGVSRTHVHALEVVDEDLLEVIPTVDGIFRQMIQPDSNRIS
jgi:hypothetical protein